MKRAIAEAFQTTCSDYSIGYNVMMNKLCSNKLKRNRRPNKSPYAGKLK